MPVAAYSIHLGIMRLTGVTIILWQAPNHAGLVLGHILQEIAGALVWTTGLAVVIDTVGEARIRKYVGYIGIALTLGTFMETMLGGDVFSRAGYNANFVMSYGHVIFDILLHPVMIERSVARTLD